MATSINLLLGTDEQGFEPNATLLSSVVRHSSLPVHARIYFRGEGENLPEDFSIQNLKVEFLRPENPPRGKFPEHVTLPTMDRLLGIRDFDDWDSALVMDYDQLCLCDLAPLFSDEFSFDDNLIAARPWHENLAKATTNWFFRTLPPEFEQFANLPFFYMGPLLNLRQMREEKFWPRFVETADALKMEEQIALSIAIEGRVKPLPSHYNLIPQWDEPDLPVDAVLHYTGPTKPWYSTDQYARLWQKHEMSWKVLRES